MLDQAILAQLPGRDQTGRRARAITLELNYPGGKRPFDLRAPVTDVAEVRLILRGFEHLGRARCRSGWWTLA